MRTTAQLPIGPSHEAANPFENMKSPAVQPTMEGKGELTIGGTKAPLSYKVTEVTDKIIDVAIEIRNAIGKAVKGFLRMEALPATATAATVAAILAGSQVESRGSIVNDGTTRDQQTAINPALNGFYASGTTLIDGFGQGPFNSSVTHLWGNVWAVAGHEVTGGSSIGSITLGNYANNPGSSFGISSITLSPYSDLAIITTTTSYNPTLDPNARLVGITVAGQGGSQNPNGGTIVNYFATSLNLQFIDQVTGANYTMADVLAGNTPFAAPETGMSLAGVGYGVWGNFSGSRNNPDGQAGQWNSLISGTAPSLVAGGYDYSNPDFYGLTTRTSDPLGGLADQLDSGAAYITIVPEPTPAALVATGAALLLASNRLLRRRD